MLHSLKIENFILIDQLALHFNDKMTVLTGETGAGKSILCDALWLALGLSSDKRMIQDEKSYCSIEVQFKIADGHIQRWLIDKGYHSVGQDTVSIVRKLPRQGNGQVWINQKPSKIKELKWLGSALVAHHNQHDQQRLLGTDYQRSCLDQYGGHLEMLQSLKQRYEEYTRLKREQLAISQAMQRNKDRKVLLAYQLAEIENSQCKPNELHALESNQKQLSNASQVLEKGQIALNGLSDAGDVNISSLLKNVQQVLGSIVNLDSRFKGVYDTVLSAGIDIEEADTALRYALSEIVVDPEQLTSVNERLQALHRLAEKHSVRIEDIPALEIRLREELDGYTQHHFVFSEIEKALDASSSQYKYIAIQLSQAREAAARRFEKAVTHKIQSLGMSKGQFKIRLISNAFKEPTVFGNERVVFHLSAALGQPLQPLSKGASGGELSRLSLVIQTLMTRVYKVPTLIFDEVDVGVGGNVAEKMGHMLEELSSTQQVLCVTHLPQIAALAQHHYVVEKHTHDTRTITRVSYIDSLEKRIQEISRMLGGTHLKHQTIAYARSMLLESGIKDRVY